MPGTIVNGARLLLFLRDDPGGWEGLCRKLNIDLTSPADTSNRMFLSEIGMAHVLGKPVVFITRSDDDIPSDIRHLDYIAYNYDEKGVADLLEKLGSIIKETLGLK